MSYSTTESQTILGVTQRVGFEIILTLSSSENI